MNNGNNIEGGAMPPDANTQKEMTSMNDETATTTDSEQDATGAIIVIGAMPPGAILTKDRLAQIFDRDPVSIERAVKRGELPHPAKLLGCERWTAGSIIQHHERRMREAAEDAAEIARLKV